MQRFDWLKLLSLRFFDENCRLHARNLQVSNDHVPIYCLAVYQAIRMCAKKVTRALPSYLEFHGMSAVTYAVKVICIGESKKHLEGMLRLFSVFGRLFFSILSQKIS